MKFLLLILLIAIMLGAYIWQAKKKKEWQYTGRYAVLCQCACCGTEPGGIQVCLESGQGKEHYPMSYYKDSCYSISKKSGFDTSYAFVMWVCDH